MAKDESGLTHAIVVGMTLRHSHDVLMNFRGRTLARLHGGMAAATTLELMKCGSEFQKIGSARMSKVAYVNGRYVLHRSAMVHIEDRGYQFAEASLKYAKFFAVP